MTRIEEIKAQLVRIPETSVTDDVRWLLERNAELLKALQAISTICNPPVTEDGWDAETAIERIEKLTHAAIAAMEKA